jgi:hypothetical protein
MFQKQGFLKRGVPDFERHETPETMSIMGSYRQVGVPRSRLFGTRGDIGAKGTVSKTHQLFKTEIMISETGF